MQNELDKVMKTFDLVFLDEEQEEDPNGRFLPPTLKPERRKPWIKDMDQPTTEGQPMRTTIEPKTPTTTRKPATRRNASTRKT